MRDPYDILGVARTANAKEIKSAYRKLAKQHHPDQNPDDPKAKDKFAAANTAYEILGDEKSRGAFDRGEIDAEGKPKFQGFPGGGAGGDPFAGFRQGRGGGAGDFRSSGIGGDDIFSHIFGDAFGQQGGPGAQARARKGEDMNVALEVSLEDVAGAAKVDTLFPDGRRIAVKLPAYLEDGQVIRLKGQGEAGPAGRGDALVKVRFARHPRYRVEGRDLHVDQPVTLREAALGEKVAVETPTGRVGLTIPAWSSSDKVLRLKGKGLPLKSGGHGDLYVHVRIMLPATPDPALEALLRNGN